MKLFDPTSLKHSIELSRNILKSQYEAKQAQIAKQKEFEYHTLVVQMIRRKYSENDEFAILRQRDSNPEEFETYNIYCEQCKTEAKSIIFGG